MLKKILAFFIDIMLILSIGFIIAFISIRIILCGFLMPGLTSENVSDSIKTFLSALNYIFEIALVYVYFIVMPKRYGNTLGRKMLGVGNYAKSKKSRYGINILEKEKGWLKEGLKNKEALNVLVKDSTWLCPSCGSINPNSHDVCRDCGQEVIKTVK
jgi:hypothetical protein